MDLIRCYEESDSESDSDSHSQQIKCMICGVADKQYKCPRCSVFTCSLACCKDHKVETGCNGRRDRVAFVGMKEFHEKTLQNDFHFLEDVLQSKGSAFRTYTTDCAGSNDILKIDRNNGRKERRHKNTDQSTTDSLPQSVKRLLKAAESRQTKLIVMPSGMSKRRLNTTQFRHKIDKIVWKVNLVFIMNSDYEILQAMRIELDGTSEAKIFKDTFVGISLPLVDENTKLIDILASIFDANSANSIQRHSLRNLRSHRDSLRCLVQKIPSPSQAPVFFELSQDFTLKDALRGKTIIEHPTIFVGTAHDTMKLECFVSSTLSSEVNMERSGATKIAIECLQSCNDGVASASPDPSTGTAAPTKRRPGTESDTRSVDPSKRRRFGPNDSSVLLSDSTADQVVKGTVRVAGAAVTHKAIVATCTATESESDSAAASRQNSKSVVAGTQNGNADSHVNGRNEDSINAMAIVDPNEIRRWDHTVNDHHEHDHDDDAIYMDDDAVKVEEEDEGEDDDGDDDDEEADYIEGGAELDDDDQAGDDDEADAEFFSALQEFEKADIESLKAIIASAQES